MRLVWVVLFVFLTMDGAPAASTHLAPSTDDKKAETFDVFSCDFLKRRKDLPFLKENWSLDATGAELLRRHPALQNEKVKQWLKENFVGVVDTGLRVRDNPAAGDVLAKDSPEVEYQSHGTHVAGIIASREFGVSPEIRVKAFPVEYRTLNQQSFNTSSGYNHRELLDAVKKAAAKNNGVTTINLSMSAEEDPAMLKLLKEALDNGKIVVYTAGNDGKLNTSGNAGFADLLRHPNLFVIGALSYLGTPSHFSNRASYVRYYVPGSAIESLDARYNANLNDAKPGISQNGTSMAAPHFSAIVQLLKAMAPDLGGEDLRRVLDESSVVRNGPPEYRQPTAYKAIDLLWRALGKGKSLKEGLALAVADSEKEALALVDKKPPAGTDCAAWKKHLDSLKQAFFLSNGKSGGEELAKIFGDRKVAERAYFAPPKAIRPAVSQLARADRMDRREGDHATAFLAGKKMPVGKEDDANAKNNAAEYLSRLPADLANVDRFLAVCRDYLDFGTIREEPCRRYLRDVSHAFLVEVGKKMKDSADWFHPELAERIIVLARNEEEKKLGITLLNHAGENWRVRNESTAGGDALRRNWSSLTQKTRDSIVGRNTPGKWEFTYEMAEMLAHGSPAQIRDHRKKLVDKLTPSDKKPLIGELKLAAFQLAAGHGKAADFIDVFDRLLAASAGKQRGQLKDYSEYANSRFNTTAILQAMAASPEVVRRVAKAFGDAKTFDALYAVANIRLLVDGIFAKIPANEAKTFLENLVARIKKFDDDRFALNLYSFLRGNAENPAVAAFLKDLVKPQKDPDLADLRQRHLEWMASNASAINDETRAFVREAEFPAVALLKIDPMLVVKDRALNELLESAIEKDEIPVFGLLSWGVSLDPKRYARLVENALPHLAKAIRGLDANAELHSLFAELVVLRGRDAKVMKTVFEAVEPFLKDDKRATQVVRAVQSLDRSVAAREYLASHPALAENLAGLLVKGSGRLDSRYPIPPSIKKALLKTLPTIETLDKSDQEPEWLDLLMREEPAGLETYLGWIASGKNPKLRSNLEDAVAGLVARHPGLRSKILEHPKTTEALRKRLEKDY